MAKNFLAGGILVLAALAAYHNSLAGPFIFDDREAIAGNATIRKLWPPGPVLATPREGGLTVSGRPLLNLSFALNYAFGGLDVRGYHVLNLVIHLLAGLTLFGIVRRTLLCPVLRQRFGATSRACGLAVALLWTLHPLQTESVTYIVQRAESLMGLFYLLTLYCFIRGTESPAPARRFDRPFDKPVRQAQALSRFDRLKTPSESRGQSKGRFDKLKALSQSKGWQVLAVAACLLGMATKEVMVSVPLIVLLYDRTFAAGTFREAWRRRRCLYVGLAGTWLLLGWLVAGTGNRGGTAGFGVGVAWWAYGATQFRALAHYLWLAVWPHPLVFDYGTAWIRRAAEVAPYAVLLIPLVAGTFIAVWRRTALGFAGAWFFAILAPTSLVPGMIQMIVEHRMYLPLAAVVSLAAPGIFALAGRRSLFLFLALAVGLGLLTSRRNEDYRSGLAIWSDTVTKRPGNAVAHNNVGNTLVESARMAEAMQHYEEALRLKPRYAEAHYNLGNVLVRMERVAEAVGCYEAAVQFQPDYAEAHHNLGAALFQTGRTEEAIRHYEELLRLRPGSVEGRFNLGNILALSGRMAEARRQFEQVLRLEPDHEKARNNLARLRTLPPAAGREN